MAALQNIADYLETDFSNSRMVLFLHKHVVFAFILLIFNDSQVYKLAIKADTFFLLVFV